MLFLCIFHGVLRTTARLTFLSRPHFGTMLVESAEVCLLGDGRLEFLGILGRISIFLGKSKDFIFMFFSSSGLLSKIIQYR